MFLLLVITLTLAALLGIKKKERPARHRRRLRTAEKIYGKIQVTEDSKVIPYLRKINPYVFEEMILLAFREKGYETRRSIRYSGDGGVDGMVRIEGQWYLIQDKRYRSHIRPEHLKDFEKVCRKRRCKGYFIHTGRTGKACREIERNSTKISIISGRRLINLLKNEM